MSRHNKEKHNGEVDDGNDSSKTGLEEKPVKCPICDKQFKNERSVPRHMKNVHADSAN